MERKRLSNSEKIVFLRNADLCAGLPAEVIEAVSSITEECNYKANEILFHEGDIGDSLYLLVDGGISIQKNDDLGLEINQPGTCIGEMALIEEDVSRSATVRITEDTKFLRIIRRDFIELLEWNFQVVEGVFRVLNAKLRSDLESLKTSKNEEIAPQESMQICKTLQQSLLPSEKVEIPNITVASYFGSAGDFGGIYYDYIPLVEEGRMGLFISNIEGDGLYPSILSVMIKSCLYPQIAFDSSVHSVIATIRQTIKSLTDIQMSMVGCYMLIDSVACNLKFANVGYPSIFLYCSVSKELVELESTSDSLGFLSENKHFVCDEREVDWQTHDILILFSCAIVEKQNSNGEVYGIDRLRKIIVAAADLSPHEIQWRILRDLGDHDTDVPSAGETMIAVIKADRTGENS